MLLLLKKPQETEPQALILPGNPLFQFTLGTMKPPTEDQNCSYVVRKDSFVMEAVNDTQLEDYLEGGEYDEVEDEIEASASDILYLPISMDLV